MVACGLCLNFLLIKASNFFWDKNYMFLKSPRLLYINYVQLNIYLSLIL